MTTEVRPEPGPAASASFPAELLSVREARHFLQRWVRDHPDLADAGEAAELALSEVVTNAVLHAHTGFDVVLRRQEQSLRVEVTDRWPGLPRLKSHGEQAATGRGLALVLAVADEFGVEAHGDSGKTVWFALRLDRRGTQLAADEPTEEDLLVAWDVDLVPDAVPTSTGGSTIVLLGLPLDLWLEARAHHDTVLRDLALHIAAHADTSPSVELHTLADRARSWVSHRVAEVTEGATGVAPATPLTATGLRADVVVEVEAAADVAFHALDELLDTAERLAGAGALLASPGAPSVVAVRRWVCAQALAQLGGQAPTAWS